VTPYELLVKARDVFAERGGAKGELELAGTGQVCALGALNVAASGAVTALWQWCDVDGTAHYVVDVPGWWAAKKLLDEQVSDHYEHNVVTLNNDLDTTNDDVLVLFDKAIAGLEEKA